jgi:serine/threonine protein phosphatase PrpC
LQHPDLKGFPMNFLKRVTSIACILMITNTHHIFPLGIFCGTYSTPGALRPEMLDAHDTHNNDDIFYAGVYDGHIKPNAANFIAQNLYINIVNDENFMHSPEIALFNGFIKTHIKYEGQDDGATVGVILVKDEVLYGANAGDVQAVFYNFDGEKLLPNLLSQIHTVDQELDRLKGLMDDACSIISTSPRDDHYPSSSQRQLSHHSRSRSIKAHTTISNSYEKQTSYIPQELAASPRGVSRIIQYPRIEDDSITSSPRMKDDIVRRLTGDGSIKEVMLQSVYLSKSHADGSGELIKPSRGVCDHRFAPYLIPDPFICKIHLPKFASAAVLASKNLWLVMEPEAVGNLVNQFLIEAYEKFQTDEPSCQVTQYIAQKLVEKAFSIQDVGNQTVTVILFDLDDN